MPTAPKKIKRPWVPERKPFQMSVNNQKVYQSYKWRKFSEAYKDRNAVCVKCDEKGMVVASAVTDHIVRIQDGGAIYDENNLQALCVSCHNSKSGKEAHGYREK